MRIAQVAPPWLPLPPRGHGGTELVVTVLTEQLDRMGHEVSLFAPGGSRSRARLVSTPDEPAGLDAMADLAFEREQINAVNRRAADFDVVHVHTARQAKMAATLDVPVVLTLHDPPSPALAEVPRRVWLVPPSRHYLDRAGPLALADPVHHGIDVAAYPLRVDKEDFLLFMGRAVPEKGLHLAIAAARQAGLPLVAVAVRSGFAREERYLAEVVAPLLSDDVTVLDQVDFAAKVDLMGRAKGFLFPIDWDEPFGLVVVEAMACGTPVIGTARATVPELVVAGATGLVLALEDFAAHASGALRDGALAAIDPMACRAHVEQMFASQVMAGGYLAAYQKAIAADAERSVGPDYPSPASARR